MADVNQFTYGCKAVPNLVTGDISVAEIYGGLAGDFDCITRQYVDRFITLVVSTRGREIRAALIALGWTPPASHEEGRK